MRRPKVCLTALAFLIFALTLTSCGDRTNNNANTANTNQVAGATATPSPAAEPLAQVEASEPPSYIALLAISADAAGGQRGETTPEIAAEVARSENNRSMAFKLPNNEPVTYMSRGESRYIILPNRRQYAEVTAGTTGFDPPRIMLPSDILDYVGRQRGFKQVGEETVNGRPAVNYTTISNTGAGQGGGAATEPFVFIDKETGLPLRMEIHSGGAGEQGGGPRKVLIEMRNVRTNVEASAFDLPQGFTRIQPEQARQYVDVISRAVVAISGTIMDQMTAGGPVVDVPTPTPTQK